MEREPCCCFWMMFFVSRSASFSLMMRREALPRLLFTRSVICETFCAGRSKRTLMMSLLIGSLRSGKMTSGVSPP